MQPHEEVNLSGEENPEIKPEENKKVALAREVLSWALHLLTAVAVAFLLGTFVFQLVRVDGSSMLDTLKHNNIMFVTKYDYLLGKPEAGDVVVCRFPGERNQGKRFVKRIVAVPGDVIEFRGGKLYRNGEEVREDYLTDSRNQSGYTMEPLLLGADEYFVCGDNRDNSHDCRTLITWTPEPIQRGMIEGHVRQVVFPLSAWKSIE